MRGSTELCLTQVPSLLLSLVNSDRNLISFASSFATVTTGLVLSLLSSNLVTALKIYLAHLQYLLILLLTYISYVSTNSVKIQSILSPSLQWLASSTKLLLRF